MSEIGLSKRDAYRLFFRDYPDVVSIEQMCQMLGGIGKKTGYRLLKEKKIEAFKIGKSYKIPKIQIISYLKVIGDPVISNPTLTPQT